MVVSVTSPPPLSSAARSGAPFSSACQRLSGARDGHRDDRVGAVVAEHVAVLLHRAVGLDVGAVELCDHVARHEVRPLGCRRGLDRRHRGTDRGALVGLGHREPVDADRVDVAGLASLIHRDPLGRGRRDPRSGRRWRRSPRSSLRRPCRRPEQRTAGLAGLRLPASCLITSSVADHVVASDETLETVPSVSEGGVGRSEAQRREPGHPAATAAVDHTKKGSRRPRDVDHCEVVALGRPTTRRVPRLVVAVHEDLQSRRARDDVVPA